MNFDLDDLAAAIMATLTPEKREGLIKAAIVALMTPDKLYGQNETPLERAFNQAAWEVARDHAKVVMNDPDVRDKILSLFNTAIDRVLNNERDKVIERIARAFQDGLRFDR